MSPLAHGGKWQPQPKYRYVFKLADGSVHHLDPRDAKRVVEKRFHLPEVCWEVRINGIFRTLWPEDILMWEQEQV
jgi:hypothetical protein